jgi:hypothetical protein
MSFSTLSDIRTPPASFYRLGNCTPTANPKNKTGEAGLRFARCYLNDGDLLWIPATLLPVPFAGESGFDPLLFTWLQVKGMPLDLFNDVFGLHLALETAQRVLERFPFLQSDFSQ